MVMTLMLMLATICDDDCLDDDEIEHADVGQTRMSSAFGWRARRRALIGSTRAEIWRTQGQCYRDLV